MRLRGRFLFHMTDNSNQSPTDDGHVASLDLLRAVASLAVCWFHFTWRDDHFLPDGWLKASGQYGWLGVEAFFVVSGFVIPWSLQRGGYLPRHYGRFILKRIVRLDPPYVLSIALVLVLAYLSTFSHLYRGKPFLIDWAQVALHLGYLNVFFPDKPWLNTVYPTLAVEFEYYLLMGLLYPLLAHRFAWVRRSTLAFFVLSCLVLPYHKHLPHYAPLFALGIIAYQLKCGTMGTREGTVTVLLVSLVALVGSDPLHVPVGLASLAVILWVSKCSPVIAFFGTISYSVYLLHVPLGSRVISLGSHWAHTFWAKVGVIAAAFAVTIVGAYLFYRLLERPSQLLSRRIKYHRPSEPARGACEATTDA